MRHLCGIEKRDEGLKLLAIDARRFPAHRCYHRFHTAANVEIPDDAHPFRRHLVREVIEYPVDGALVENSVVAEAPEIQLEALELEAAFRGNVGDANRAEVGRTALEQRELLGVALYSTKRAKRRELRAVHVDLVVTVGIWIVEGLEEVGAGHTEQCTVRGRGSMQPRGVLASHSGCK